MENQNMENVTATEGVGTDTGTVQEPTEKLFTQEQVNEIIKKRLKNQKEVEICAQEMNSRAAELTARESMLNCREYLMEKGYPSELLDIIDTSDAEAFKTKADKASGVFASMAVAQNVAPLADLDNPVIDPVSAVFTGASNTKHTPKGYWPTDPRRKE